MRFSAALALAAPLAVSAIEFTSPSLNSTVTKGSKYELSWDTVDTDPSVFSVYLVNFVNWPPSYTLLAQNIETASGAASVDVPCSAISSGGYQFNAINGTNVYVIYAQTPKFAISGDDCTDPTPIGAEPSTCAPPATVTVTVSKTLSRSNSTATATGGISAAQQVTPTPAVVTQVTTIYQGVCPDTIGWSAGYNHPVTLTKPPRAPNSPEPTGSFNGGADDNVKTVYRTTYLPLELAPTACGC
ncbi:hypothetical protein CcaCcLH18_05621 [Colletotrichum camelliae]|nr:hypothetical protein CcaCcLH18_05621 [Colletotrichum camelliae]